MFSDPAETLTIKDPTDSSKTMELKWMDLEQADAVRTGILGQANRTQQSMTNTLTNLVKANEDAERLEEEIRDLELQLDLAAIEADNSSQGGE